jgi:hypothetical protein
MPYILKKRDPQTREIVVQKTIDFLIVGHSGTPGLKPASPPSTTTLTGHAAFPTTPHTPQTPHTTWLYLKGGRGAQD